MVIDIVYCISLRTICVSYIWKTTKKKKTTRGVGNFLNLVKFLCLFCFFFLLLFNFSFVCVCLDHIFQLVSGSQVQPMASSSTKFEVAKFDGTWNFRLWQQRWKIFCHNGECWKRWTRRYLKIWRRGRSAGTNSWNNPFVPARWSGLWREC